MQSQPPPKGSLEELFRHHLLESEAAAVPPRPLVWEHIDNSLLLAQNEKYRRRLLVHRWGMAASLLLAALAGGGWWHSQQIASTNLATTQPQREATRRAVAGAVPPRHVSAPAETASLATAAVGSTKRLVNSSLEEHFTKQGATNHQAASATGRGLLAYAAQGGRSLSATGAANPLLADRYAAQSGARAYAPGGRLPLGTSRAANTSVGQPFSYSSPNVQSIAATTTSSFVDLPSAALSAHPVGVSESGTPTEATQAATAVAMPLAARMGEDLLATRFTALALAPAGGLPTELNAKELPAPSPTLLRRWRYGAEYAISAFQPNIDFNRNTTDYNPALGTNTVSLTRAAAAEYRANLRAGLGQRLTLRATRWLGGHWSLGTGVEVAQQEAYSATSAAFTGEQLADLSSFAVSPVGSTNQAYSHDLRESSFRYRSVGVPIELQYDNQAKPGLSLYGRLGAIVSALLNVRSEVASNPEATRTYSITSASTPYRRLTALLRGSAGVRYRPAGRKWGLKVGPTAEAGVQSLNSETDRPFLQQSRPYSVGLEAGFEFGGSPKPLPASRY